MFWEEFGTVTDGFYCGSCRFTFAPKKKLDWTAVFATFLPIWIIHMTALLDKHEHMSLAGAYRHYDCLCDMQEDPDHSFLPPLYFPETFVARFVRLKTTGWWLSFSLFSPHKDIAESQVLSPLMVMESAIFGQRNADVATVHPESQRNPDQCVVCSIRVKYLQDMVQAFRAFLCIIILSKVWYLSP
jgi:hypothetical protein